MKLYILGLLILIGILSILFICTNLRENMEGEKENQNYLLKNR